MDNNEVEENLDESIFHLTRGDLSQNNMDILEQIKSNKNIEVVNQLLAQAYLFLNTQKNSCLDISDFKFRCISCKGCGASYEDCDSKYCLHANDCDLAKFIETLEKTFNK